jgi:hypothetical protein
MLFGTYTPYLYDPIAFDLSLLGLSAFCASSSSFVSNRDACDFSPPGIYPKETFQISCNGCDSLLGFHQPITLQVF